MGCIGMTRDDFCKCTYEEFDSICEAWQRMRREDSRDAWERARIMATIAIQPHVKKRMTPRQLLPLPWNSHKPDGATSPDFNRHLTPEEQRKRFEKLARLV